MFKSTLRQTDTKNVLIINYPSLFLERSYEYERGLQNARILTNNTPALLSLLDGNRVYVFAVPHLPIS